MSWTEDKVNKLKELWGKEHTASQIAEIIGGISKCCDWQSSQVKSFSKNKMNFHLGVQ